MIKVLFSFLNISTLWMGSSLIQPFVIIVSEQGQRNLVNSFTLVAVNASAGCKIKPTRMSYAMCNMQYTHQLQENFWNSLKHRFLHKECQTRIAKNIKSYLKKLDKECKAFCQKHSLNCSPSPF